MRTDIFTIIVVFLNFEINENIENVTNKQAARSLWSDKQKLWRKHRTNSGSSTNIIIYLTCETCERASNVNEPSKKREEKKNECINRCSRIRAQTRTRKFEFYRIRIRNNYVSYNNVLWISNRRERRPRI